MSLGSSALGSTALGGVAAARGLLFTAEEPLTAGTHRRTLGYNGSAEFFEIIQTQIETAEPNIRTVKIYVHNDPGETPQGPIVSGEAFYAQNIIGAARFIVVDLELTSTLSSIGINISGSEYFQ